MATEASNTKSLWNSFPKHYLTYLVVYPFILRACYLLRQSIEPSYMNGTCLMDLVRVSSPEHYDVHPFWKYYQQANSSRTCETETNSTLEDFFVKLFQNGLIEMYVFYGYVLFQAVVGLGYLINRLVSRKFVSFSTFIGFSLIAYCQGSVFHCITHYQNDLTHLNGNVMHHSEFKVDGQNGSLVGTLPPGLLYVFFLNFFITSGLFYGILTWMNRDATLYTALSTIVIPAKMLFNMKVIHPYIHTFHKSWYPWPMNLVFRDYNGHVLCHHVSGYCLGDLPYVLKPYDWLMKIHGELYQRGILVFGTTSHVIGNILTDYILIILSTVMALLLIFTFSPLLGYAQKYSNPKATKKVN